MKKHLTRMLSALAIIALGATMLAGCQKEEETVSEPVSEVVSDVEEPVVEIDTHEGEAKSYLSGEWIDEDIANQRPFAVMYGNTNESGVLPQSGIGSADIIYEVTVEGGITRLMALFQDYAKIEKIESVRSCRLYFLEFASEYDAFYGHWGQSKYAKSALSAYEDLDGMSSTLYGLMYFRDSAKSAPHNGYTTGEGIVSGIEAMGYEKYHDSDYEGHFTFAEDDDENTLSDGEDAGYIMPGYSVNKPWFEYDETSGLYMRYQFGSAQTDALTSEQLGFKNIIFEYINEGYMDSKTLNIPTNGSGNGKFFTNGKMIDITWSKETTSSVTHYYEADGDEITLNQGKTWICVIDSSKTGNVVIKDSTQE